MVFAINNLFLIWLGIFALAIWRRSQWAIALADAALLHLALDFPLHHYDRCDQFLAGFVVCARKPRELQGHRSRGTVGCPN